MQADIGLIGLAVMGENLVLNMESKGFTVAVYNRTLEKVRNFIGGRAAGKNILGAYSPAELVSLLKKPRRVMMMVKAGTAVDTLIETLLPLLDPGDIIIDGGNSHYNDTERRTKYVESKGLFYIGTGISGGEEGALHGPSIMPGGSEAAWPYVRDLFRKICAFADDGHGGTAPCCEWIGTGGAGHFVKMVHNGIEYGDMQLICETYDLMRRYLKMTADEMADVFSQWNAGELDSYLIEITADILRKKDEDGRPLVEHILDVAGQKGTGQWSSQAAYEEGVPLTLIGESVFSRYLSVLKEERIAASRVLPWTAPEDGAALREAEKASFLTALRDALYASKIVSYAQGCALMAKASEVHGWNLDLGSVALLWRGGCIIRSSFLGKIKDAYEQNPNLKNLMLDSFFASRLSAAQKGWRLICAKAAETGIPTPAFFAALSYFDGYRAERLPANLLQAQRDYFGAHTYERTDTPRGEFRHTDWQEGLKSGTYYGPLDEKKLERILEKTIGDYTFRGKKVRRLLIIPPDYTRCYSGAGIVTQILYRKYTEGGAEVDILPALGTHAPMTAAEISDLYAGIPQDRFLVHNWREDVVKIGTVPAEFISEISDGIVNEPIDVEVNRLLVSGSYDLILSVGQVVPHEVVGMANRNKNIFVGCGGNSMINGSHMLGAFYGLERIMGLDHTPVRRVFDYAEEKYLSEVPLSYILTVTDLDPSGKMRMHGLFVGRERHIFESAVALSTKVNIIHVEKPLRTVVVMLEEKEFKSTWLGNKAIYRTRKAIADGGELYVLAPGVERFGEDAEIDTLIRKYGYTGRENILRKIQEAPELRENLSAAAHLIHGSSDGRFRITYCTKHLSAEEVESVGFRYLPYEEAVRRFQPEQLAEGMNQTDAGEIYYIGNPALGLWSV